MGTNDRDNLSLPASELPLSVRSRNCLERADIQTVGELLGWSAVKLLRLPHFGRTSLEDIQAALADLDLELAPSESAPSASRDGSATGVMDDATGVPEDAAYLSDWQKGLLTLSIGTLALTKRGQGALAGIGCRTVADVVMLRDQELLRAKNLGRTTVAEIATTLQELGLRTGLRIAAAGELETRMAEWSADFASAAREHMARRLEDRILQAAEERTDLGSRLRALLTVLVEDPDTVRQQRNLSIFAHLYGWDGGPGCTLEAAGKVKGLTRERVRQLSTKFEERIRNLGVVPVWLTDAVAALEAVAPCRLENSAAALEECGITLGDCDIRGVLCAADHFGIRPDLSVPTSGAMAGILCTSRQARLGTRALARARALTSRYGCFSRDTLVARFQPDGSEAAETRRMFPLIADHSRITWLDDRREWGFVPGAARSRLLGVVRKTLSVAEWVGLDEIRSAIRRNRHMEGFAPRRDVLLAILKHVPWIEMDGEQARGIDLDAQVELLGNDRIFWETLMEAGGVLDRYTLIDRCIRRGMNFTSCHLLLNYSPVVTPLSPYVHALAGTKVSAEQLTNITPAPRRERVLQDFGRSEHGRSWMVVRATAATIANGLINIPSALCDDLQGNFTLQSTTSVEETDEPGSDDMLDDAPLTVRVSRTILAGLHPALAERAVEAGDYILITFDPAHRTVGLRVGDHNLAAEVLG